MVMELHLLMFEEDFSHLKGWTLEDIGIATSNMKDMNTISGIVKVKSMARDPSSNTLRSETEVSACSVNGEMTVLGCQGIVASESKFIVNDNKKVGTTLLPKILKIESIPKEPPNGSLKDEMTVLDSQRNATSEFDITVNDSKEIDNILLGVVKVEPELEEPTVRSLKDKTEVTAGHKNSKRTVFGSHDSGVPESGESNLLSVLNVKVKREEEDKTKITRELVAYVCGNSACDSQKLEQVVKCENNCGSSKEENKSDDCENGFTDNDFSAPAVKKGPIDETNKKRFNGSQMHSKIYYALGSLKLRDVSVKLKDLFPNYLRKLGKVHVNSGSCLCIYCRGDQNSYAGKSGHISKKLQNEKQRTSVKNSCQKPKNSQKCQVGYVVKSHQKVGNDKTLFQHDVIPLKCEDKGVSNAPLNIHRGGKILRHNCKFCPEYFTSMSFYHSHLEKVHNVDKSFKCKQCPAEFWYAAILKVHLRVHTKERPFKCKQCSAKFTQGGTLNIHLNTHSVERPLKCAQCPASFKFKCNLTVHLRVHSGEKPFSCKHCPAKFTTSTSLKNHLRVHSGEKPFKCKLCPLRFSKKSSASSHIRTVHSITRPFECKLCSAKFKLKTYLSRHLRVHSYERPFECKLCPAKYKWKSELTVHLRTHSGKKPFTCKLCPAKFAGNSGLYKHKVVHSHKRPFECKLCPAKFKTKSTLTTHLRVHSGERPFKCMHCVAKFTLSSSLNRHLRRQHSSETLLACAHCSAKFKVKPNLIYHLKKCH